MSQNKQHDVDRKAAASDYPLTVKAERELALLHENIGQLREREVLEPTEAA